MAMGLNVEMSHSGPRGVYTARAGRTYQYRIVPTYGTPKLLTLEEASGVTIDVKTEPEAGTLAAAATGLIRHDIYHYSARS